MEDKIKKHKMSSKNRHVMLFDIDRIIATGGDLLVNKYNIPYNNTSYYHADKIFSANKNIISRPFDSLSTKDKLYLYGHGSPDLFTGKSPAELAGILHAAGLKEVGIIKFRSCHIADKTYLKDFAEEITKRNINWGYITGSKDNLYNHDNKISILGKDIRTSLWTTKKSDLAFSEAYTNNATYNPRDLSYLDCSSGLVSQFAEASAGRVKDNMQIVVGPAAISFPGTVYTKDAGRENKPQRRPFRAALLKLARLAFPDAPPDENLGKPAANRIGPVALKGFKEDLTSRLYGDTELVDSTVKKLAGMCFGPADKETPAVQASHVISAAEQYFYTGDSDSISGSDTQSIKSVASTASPARSPLMRPRSRDSNCR